MNNKMLSLLGIARRAGRLSLGHDAVIQSIVENRAKLCICAEDASQRLQNEVAHACGFDNKNIPFCVPECSAEQLSKAVGQKVSVLSVDDEGFAAAITKTTEEG